MGSLGVGGRRPLQDIYLRRSADKAHPESSLYRRRGKLVLDLVVAGLLLVMLLPVLEAIALLVLWSLGSPVLYRQERVGQHGKTFTMYKFRTMLPDRRRHNISHEGPERRIYHKQDSDPRHTKVGRVLRKWSLDELPQLVNVLRGEMSLIGPRPELVQVVRAYEPWQHHRHQVKPGLTGLWQITNRGALMHDYVELDLDYVERLSLRGDLRILVRTVPAVLSGQRGS